MKNSSWSHAMTNKIMNKTDLNIKKNLGSRYSFATGEVVHDVGVASFVENSLTLDCKNFNVHVDFKLGQTSKDTPSFITSDKNSSIIYLNLYMDNILVDLTGCVVDMNIRNPESSTFTVPCVILDATNGLIEFKIPEKCKNLSGNYQMEALVSIDDKELATPVTIYHVAEGIGRTASQVMQKTIMTHLGEDILTSNENPILYREEDVIWRQD